MYLKQPMGTAGQGLNMTMEDAAELAWHVQQYGLTVDALERFEAKRLPRVKTILDHAKVNRHCTYLSCLSSGKQRQKRDPDLAKRLKSPPPDTDMQCRTIAWHLKCSITDPFFW
jgi:2-polyprenyl-6-methoxyphenol hydroxylase-like FAD-dependent oxidoreductase